MLRRAGICVEDEDELHPVLRGLKVRCAILDRALELDRDKLELLLEAVECVGESLNISQDGENMKALLVLLTILACGYADADVLGVDLFNTVRECLRRSGIPFYELSNMLIIDV